jgi:glycosyltransferase involved in cell wall biosynthesis
MNLLFVNPTFRKWGGVEEVVVLLVEHLRASGHRVVIVSEDTRATLEGRFHPEVVHYALPLRRKAPFVALSNALEVLRIARRERIDLISSHQKKTSVVCLPAARVLGVPLVHTAHNQMADWRARWFGFFGRNIIANSVETKQYMVRHFGVRPKYITVIHSTARMAPPPLPAEVEQVRATFGLQPDQPVLVCLARLSGEKGHSVLLRAMLAIRHEFPKVRLLIVGKGHLRQQLEALAASLGLGDGVTFTGYQRYPGPILAAATAAVLPSLHEAFPLVNIECLRLGLPVVSTAVDGVPEVIQDGKTGILVPPGDAAALAEGVCRMLRNPDLARTLACNGRTFVLERFDPTLMCRRYEAYFAQVSGLDPEAGAAREVGCDDAQS